MLFGHSTVTSRRKTDNVMESQSIKKKTVHMSDGKKIIPLIKKRKEKMIKNKF